MQNIDAESFYSNGLRFECTRCSRCCRHTPGYVFLSSADLSLLAHATGAGVQEFRWAYCRDVDFGLTRRVSLRERANFDCIFWEKDGCSVYEARPLQCRSFPFWSGCLGSREEWDLHAQQCPGMGRGPLHSRREIEKWLAQRHKEGFLEA
jgi:uncharacterized protein